MCRAPGPRLKPLLFEVFSGTGPDAEALIEEYIEMYKTLDQSGDLAKRIDTIRRVLHEAKRDAAQGIINREFIEQVSC